MSTIRKNAVAEREVTHFVLASLSNYDRFPYSFFALVTIFFLRPYFYPYPHPHLYPFLGLYLFMSI